MARIGHIKEIIEVKECLEELQNNGLIAAWELPYENLLTRLSAAIFFITPVSQDYLPEIWNELSKFANFRYKANELHTLSNLQFRVEFNKEND